MLVSDWVRSVVSVGAVVRRSCRASVPSLPYDSRTNGGEVGRGVSEAFLVLSSFGSVGGSVGGVVSGSRGGHGIGNGDIDIGGVEIVSVNNV